MYKTTVNRMKLKGDSLEIVRELTHNSKNLYNATLYATRQHFFNTGKFLTYNQAYHVMKNSEEYKSLPAQSAQQTMKVVERSFKSFFGVLREKRKGNYNRPTSIPKYLPKDGKFVVIFPKAHIRFDKKLGKHYLTIPTYLKERFKVKGLFIDIPEFIDASQLKEIRINPTGSFYRMEYVYRVDNTPVEHVDNGNFLSIDLGISNLATMVNNVDNQPIIVNGGEIKSINRYFNKKIGAKKSYTKKHNGTYKSQAVSKLYQKRDDILKDTFHKLSLWIIRYCQHKDISTIIVGYNKEWKQNVNLGKKNNQNFVQIPFGKFISYLEYKGALCGIKVVLQEESYTSKCDSLALESVERHDCYLGKRVHRGLFRSSTGKAINADVNGAINIARKCKGEETNPWVQSLAYSGCVYQPVKVSTRQLPKPLLF